MAHPTIDLTDQPNPDCLHPAYNCVKYCFKSNDFQTQTGTKAKFTIETPAIINGYGPGVPMTIAGVVYQTGIIAQYNEVDTAPVQTQTQLAESFKSALESNSYLFSTFEFSVSGIQLIATAREIGEVDNFIFDFSDPGFVGNPPIYTDTQGTPDLYLDNYRLIVEVWQETIPQLGQTELIKISSEAYIPNSDGTFCINIGQKIAPLLETFFPFDLGGSIVFADTSISGSFFLRYGESYSETINSCDVELKTFENSPQIGVINSAFQREDQIEKTALMCEHQWMTNAPQFTQVCEDSDFVLWINLNSVIFPAPTTVQVRGKYIFTYTDGTTSTHLTGIYFYNSLNKNQVFAVQAGKKIIPFIATPGKTIASYEVRIQQQDGALIQDYGSQFFKRVPCCDGDVEFYFLNEYGGFDTILFTQVDSIELSQSNAIFEQFTDCEETDTLRTGQKIIDQTANDIYSVTSKFPDNYDSRKWIREFLASPIKTVSMKIQGEETLSKVIVPPGSVEYFSEDDNFVFLRIQFQLNESINLQKN